MKLFSVFITATSLFVLTACTKDVGPNPDLVVKETNPCDTITVSYTNHVQSIIANKCLTCHSPATGGQLPDLSSYAFIKTKADEGRIKARAIDQSPSRMPPAGNPVPTDDELKLIKCWLDAGAPNN